MTGVVLVKVGLATLEEKAAASYRRCLEAGAPIGVTSSYRDRRYQQYLYDGWTHRLPGFNFALPPDQSDHVKGIAIDLPTYVQRWFREHGKEYGWIFTDATEKWHIAYRAKYDQHINDVPKPKPVEVVKPAPVVTNSEDDIMKAIRSTNGRIALVGPGYFRHLEPVEWSAIRKLYAYTQVTDEEYDIIEVTLTPSK